MLARYNGVRRPVLRGGCDLRDCERWPECIALQLKIAVVLRAVVLGIGS